MILDQSRICCGGSVNRPRLDDRTRSNCQAIVSVLYWPPNGASEHCISALQGDHQL